MTRSLLYVIAALSLGCLAPGYFLAGHFLSGLALLALGLLWIIGLVRCWDWAPDVGLLIAFGFAALGILFNLGPVLLTAGAIFALVAWDLAGFAARSRLAAAEDDRVGLERRHLMRLGVVVLIGVGLTCLSFWLRLRGTFELTVALVFLAIWGIGQVVKWLLKQQ